MDQSQEILLGHAIFASIEYGHRRIARSISNKSCAVSPVLMDGLLFLVGFGNFLFVDYAVL